MLTHGERTRQLRKEKGATKPTRRAKDKREGVGQIGQIGMVVGHMIHVDNREKDVDKERKRERERESRSPRNYASGTGRFGVEFGCALRFRFIFPGRYSRLQIEDQVCRENVRLYPRMIK